VFVDQRRQQVVKLGMIFVASTANLERMPCFMALKRTASYASVFVVGAVSVIVWNGITAELAHARSSIVSMLSPHFVMVTNP
jgi:hypothetical protein